MILSYSVAKNIQENLLSLDFNVDLPTGIGKKKNNLLATAINQNSIVPIKNKKIVIIGAGIGGTFCAYFLSSSGFKVTLIESNSKIMSEASSVPIAMIRPYFSPKDTVYNQFLFSSFIFASNFYKYLKITNLKTGIKKHNSIFIPNKNFKFSDFFVKLLTEKKFIDTADTNFFNQKNFLLKNTFSVHTKSFREMIYSNLKDKVNFQFGSEIEKINFKDEQYELLSKEKKMVKADIVIYAGGFKSSKALLENSELLKPSFGQQDFIKQFDHFSLPYLGDIYLNKFDAKQFIVGSTYHDGITHNTFMNSDSKMLLDKINKYFRDIEIKKLGSWTSTRSITPDRRPLFGEIKQNFFTFTGFGSNGFTIAPILGFLISKKILGVDLLGLNQIIKTNTKRFNKVKSKKNY